MALGGSITLEELAAEVRPYIEDDRDDYRSGKIAARQFKQTIVTVVFTIRGDRIDQEMLYGICRMLDMSDGEITGLMSVTE